MKTHTIVGEQMLDQIGGLLGEVGGIVRSCHERWDGSGLSGRAGGRGDPARGAHRLRVRRLERDDDRPLLPRRPAPTTEAAAELRACAGTHFDPRVVDALLDVVNC